MALTTIDDRGLKTPIDLLDNEKIRFGTGNDLEIYHAGNHARIHNTTGNFSCQSTNYYFNSAGGADNCLDIIGDGAVKLYYDGVKKVETSSTGFFFDGTGGDTYWLDNSDGNGLKWRYTDNVKGCYGTGDDLQIYHDGTNSYIYNDTGELKLRAATFKVVNEANSEIQIQATEDGAVELYYDDTKQFETVSGGVQITGNLGIGVTPNRELHVKGLDAIVRLESTSATGRNVLEFYDNTGSKGYIGYPSTSNDQFAIGNNDNTDMWFSTNDTERLRITNGGVVRIPDNGKFTAGAGDDLQIFHDGGSSFINNNLGHFYIRNNVDDDDGSNIYIQPKSGEGSIACIHDGPVELYCNDSKKIQTQDAGITVYGTIHIGDGASGTAAGLGIGDGDDLQIYHNGTDSYLDNAAGNLQLRVASTEKAVVAVPNGATELYHDSVKKFETWSGGSVFDYYEEGSWTPGFSSTVLNSMGNPLLTDGSYDYRVARYVKIGPFVCISVHIQLTSNFAYETGASGTTSPIGIGGMPAGLGPGVNTNPRFIPGAYVWREGGSSGTTKTFHARISSFFNPQFIEICDEGNGGVGSLAASDVIEDDAQFHLNFSYVLAS